MLEAIFSIFTTFDFAAFPAAFFSLFDFSTYTLFTWAAFALTVIGMVLSLFFWLNRDIRKQLNLGGALSFFFTAAIGTVLMLSMNGLLIHNTGFMWIPVLLPAIINLFLLREYCGAFFGIGAAVAFGSFLLLGFLLPQDMPIGDMVLASCSQAIPFSGLVMQYVIIFTDIAENGLYPKKPRRNGRKRGRLADTYYTKKRHAERAVPKSKPSSSRTSSYSSSGSSYSSYDSGYKDVNASRAELQNQFIHGRLSLAEKERLAKEHNDKYFDAVRVDENGLYQNVYGHPDDFKQDLSQD